MPVESAATPRSLPRRDGPPPRCATPAPTQTRSTFIHRQLTQNPDAVTHAALVADITGLRDVVPAPSLISVEGALGFFVTGDVHRPGIHMRGTEFCHVHPVGDSSLHVAVDEATQRWILAAGRGEPHPLVPFTVLLYAPREVAEVAVVVDVVRACHDRALRARRGRR